MVKAVEIEFIDEKVSSGQKKKKDGGQVGERNNILT